MFSFIICCNACPAPCPIFKICVWQSVCVWIMAGSLSQPELGCFHLVFVSKIASPKTINNPQYISSTQDTHSNKQSNLGMKRFDSNSHHSIDYRLQMINRYDFWHRVSTRTKAFCEKLTQIEEINVLLIIFALRQVEYGGRHFTIQTIITWSGWC